MNEDERYAAVNAQIKQLLDDAANDTNPATAIQVARCLGMHMEALLSEEA